MDKTWTLPVAAILVVTMMVILPVQPAEGQAPPTALRFGVPGTPAMDVVPAPAGRAGANSAGEPTLGINWKSDDVMMMSGTTTHWASFTDVPDGNGDLTAPPTFTWEVRTPQGSVVNLDPMLHTDAESGRTWAGGLNGQGSVMFYSDDDGINWNGPIYPAGVGTGFDHQSIGTAPWTTGTNPTAPVSNTPYAMYYCSQLGQISCARSADGGQSWTPISDADVGSCSGLHGHLRSGPDGTVYLPIKNCGFVVTTDEGAVWSPRTVPGYDNQGAWDPSIGVSRDSGVLYFGTSQSTGGAYVAVSKDRGLTWDDVGQGQGAAPGTKFFDIGAELGIKRVVFPDMQAGDDGRAAFGFLGSKVDAPDDDCDPNGPSKDHVWHYYIGFTYDFGNTWNVQQVTTDPVQKGGVYSGGATGGGDASCRNMLDFNDMDIDSEGRVYAVIADGCRGCDVGDWSSQYLTLIRQRTGCGLFALEDAPETPESCAPEPIISVTGPTADFTCMPDTRASMIGFNDASLAGDEAIGTWAWDFGDGQTLSGTETNPEHPYDPGTYVINLTVTDANGLTSSVEKECTLQPNQPPMIIAPPPTTKYEGAYIQEQLGGTDPDGDPLTFYIDPDNAPEGLYFDTLTGRFTWLVPQGGAGTYGPIKVGVTDGMYWSNSTLTFHIKAIPKSEQKEPTWDSDGDGLPDERDACPGQPGRGDGCPDEAPGPTSSPRPQAPTDVDEDGVIDAVDNCPHVANTGQDDTDRDGVGDACDEDIDGDLVPQVARVGTRIDNCPLTPNPSQADLNQDNIGDACSLQPFEKPMPSLPGSPPPSGAPHADPAGSSTTVGLMGILAATVLAAIGLFVLAGRLRR